MGVTCLSLAFLTVGLGRGKVTKQARKTISASPNQSKLQWNSFDVIHVMYW